MNGISRTHLEQRSFVIGGHHIRLEKERDTRRSQVVGVGDTTPECVVQTQVEITGECHDCHCKFEMIAGDDNAEIQRVERYIFGAFVAHPCANIDRKV
jgi:hypothetical protein